MEKVFLNGKEIITNWRKVRVVSPQELGFSEICNSCRRNNFKKAGEAKGIKVINISDEKSFKTIMNEE